MAYDPLEMERLLRMREPGEDKFWTSNMPQKIRDVRNNMGRSLPQSPTMPYGGRSPKIWTPLDIDAPTPPPAEQRFFQQYGDPGKIRVKGSGPRPIQTAPGTTSTNVKLNVPKLPQGTGKVLQGLGRKALFPLEVYGLYEGGKDLIQQFQRGEGYAAIPGLIQELTGNKPQPQLYGPGGDPSGSGRGQAQQTSPIVTDADGTVLVPDPTNSLPGAMRPYDAPPGSGDRLDMTGGAGPIEEDTQKGTENLIVPGAPPAPVLPPSPADTARGTDTGLTYGAFSRDILSKFGLNAVAAAEQTPGTLSMDLDFDDRENMPAGPDKITVFEQGKEPKTEKNRNERINNALSGIKRYISKDEDMDLGEDAKYVSSKRDKASSAFLDYDGPGGSLGALRARDDALDLAYHKGQYYGVNREAAPNTPESMVKLKPEDVGQITSREQQAQDLLASYKSALSESPEVPGSTPVPETATEDASSVPAVVDTEGQPSGSATLDTSQVVSTDTVNDQIKKLGVDQYLRNLDAGKYY